MPLIVNGVARFSIIGSLFGQDCVNVFDVRLTTTAPTSREDACFDTAGDILNNWSDHILPRVSAGYEAREVRWVDLNSEGGSTGSRSSTSDTTWPENGAVEENTLPNNVYVKVRKVLEGKTRQQRNGTTRLGGIPESATVGADGNVLNTTYITALNDAFEDFKDGINDGTPLGTSSELVMVHTVDGEADGYSVISSFAVTSVVGTLRRRMPGYGS